MKVAITTPTGNIGRTLTQLLLDRGAEVILLARNPEKVKEFTDRGATLRQGSLDDENYVIEATVGADVLFWLTPPNYAAEDFRGYQNRLGRIAAKAVAVNKIPRVVDLSSIGAQHDAGIGPISGLRDVEKLLEGTGAHVTHLRPAFFMENLFFSAETIASDGAIFLPAPGSTSLSMVATTDIAKAAADRILDESWTGTSVLEVLGPREVTLEEAAEAVGRALGKKVAYVAVTPDQARQAMQSQGMSASIAGLFLEMYGAFGEGKVVPETKNPVRARTTLETFVQNVFRPRFESLTA